MSFFIDLGESIGGYIRDKTEDVIDWVGDRLEDLGSATIDLFSGAAEGAGYCWDYITGKDTEETRIMRESGGLFTTMGKSLNYFNEEAVTGFKAMTGINKEDHEIYKTVVRPEMEARWTGHNSYLEGKVIANYDKLDVLLQDLQNIRIKEVEGARDACKTQLMTLNNVKGFNQYVMNLNVNAYDEVFDSISENIEYIINEISAKAQAIKDYSEMSGTEKAWNTVGVSSGKILQGVFGMGEHITDAGFSLLGLATRPFSKSTSDFFSDLAKQDTVDYMFGDSIRRMSKGSYITEDSYYAKVFEITGTAAGSMVIVGGTASIAGGGLTAASTPQQFIGPVKLSTMSKAAVATQTIAGYGGGTESALQQGKGILEANLSGVKQSLVQGGITLAACAIFDNTDLIKAALTKNSQPSELIVPEGTQGAPQGTQGAPQGPANELVPEGTRRVEDILRDFSDNKISSDLANAQLRQALGAPLADDALGQQLQQTINQLHAAGVADDVISKELATYLEGQMMNSGAAGAAGDVPLITAGGTVDSAAGAAGVPQANWDVGDIVPGPSVPGEEVIKHSIISEAKNVLKTTGTKIKDGATAIGGTIKSGASTVGGVIKTGTTAAGHGLISAGSGALLTAAAHPYATGVTVEAVNAVMNTKDHNNGTDIGINGPGSLGEAQDVFRITTEVPTIPPTDPVPPPNPDPIPGPDPVPPTDPVPPPNPDPIPGPNPVPPTPTTPETQPTEAPTVPTTPETQPTEVPTIAPTNPPTESPTEAPINEPTNPPIGIVTEPRRIVTDPPTNPSTNAPTQPGYTGGGYSEGGGYVGETPTTPELEEVDIEDLLTDDVIKGGRNLKIPTSSIPINNKITPKSSGNSVIPIVAGLSAAAAAGIGAKAYMDRKKNTDNGEDDDFSGESWSEGDGIELNENIEVNDNSDNYLNDDDDYAYQNVETEKYGARSADELADLQ